MKIAFLIFAGLSVILLLSTIVCGLWIRSGGEKVTDVESSVKFHLGIGVLTALSTLVTIVLAVVKFLKVG